MSEEAEATNVDSKFFSKGYFPKADACPKVFKIVGAGDRVCGHPIEAEEIGSSKFDAKASLERCYLPLPNAIIETKFNGNRAIVEYENGKARMFSEKGENDKPFPSAITHLIANYMANTYPESKINGKTTIFDGEAFLKECDEGGRKIVPEVGVQTAAIKGDHPDLMKKCSFSYKVFDIVKLNGVNLSEETLENRKKILKSVVPITLFAKMSDLVDTRDERGVAFQTPENISVEPVFGKQMSSVNEVWDEYCRAIDANQEGLVIKNPKSKYIWVGKTAKTADRSAWKKIKEEFDVDTSVMKACLGEWKKSTKTNQHLTRYKDLRLHICKDEDCRSTIEVAKSESQAEGSAIVGWKGKNSWNDAIHAPLLKLLREGKAKPTSGTKYRSLQELKNALRSGKLSPMNSEEEMEAMMGCPNNCYKDPNGNIALPECIDIPKNAFIVEVATTDINMDAEGVPHLGGPPRIIRVREDKSAPNNLAYLRSLYGQEVGVL